MSLPPSSSPSGTTSSAYANLSASPALQMALLMQSQQQLRALTAQVNASGQSLPSLSLPLPPLPTVVTSPTSLASVGGMTTPSMGVSTVLATPLPKSLSPATPGGQSSGRKGGGGGGTKRENASSSGSGSKRYKVGNRKSVEQSEKNKN